jgi:hypothetical protein
MEYISEDRDYWYFRKEINGHAVRSKKNKKTGEVRDNYNDIAKALGYSGFNDWLGGDLHITEERKEKLRQELKEAHYNQMARYVGFSNWRELIRDPHTTDEAKEQLKRTIKIRAN